MAYPMVKADCADCTDGKDGVEVVSRNPSILGNAQVITWCPKFGTLCIITTHANGTVHRDKYETKIPELAAKEFRKSKLRRLIDKLLDLVC